MPEAAPRRTDRRAERHESTKRQIVEIAWRLSDERGLAGWSLRDVAEIVGMRAPSLYVYFDSKNALYDAMFADGYRDLLDRTAATPTGADPVTMLHRASRVFFEFAVERPARYQLLFLRTIPGFEPSPESYMLASQSLEDLREVLDDVGAGDDSAADLFTALMSGLATQQVSNDPGGDRWERLLDGAVDMYLDAVRGAGTAPPGKAAARRQKRRLKG
jgi:AcrR family transcriptional regulator